jgi:hypothetical protein
VVFYVLINGAFVGQEKISELSVFSNMTYCAKIS